MQHYKHAIDIISKDISLERLQTIAIDYAKRHPKAFCEAAMKGKEKPADQALLGLAQRKIEAIKLRRQQSGEGLKEAKAYVDELFARHGL